MPIDTEFKDRVGLILGIEERPDNNDWALIAALSLELLQMLPESAPDIVRAYLVDSDKRRFSRDFAQTQRAGLVQYLRSGERSGDAAS